MSGAEKILDGLDTITKPGPRKIKARLVTHHPFVELDADAVDRVADLCALSLDFTPKWRIVAAIIAAYHGELANRK